MIRFLRVVLLVLVAIVFLGFAFANRHEVIVSFDPFASLDSAALSIVAPLFAVGIVAAMCGVVAGSLATWRSQGRYRRALRQNRKEVNRWRTQAEALKAAQARETLHPVLPGE